MILQVGADPTQYIGGFATKKRTVRSLTHYYSKPSTKVRHAALASRWRQEKMFQVYAFSNLLVLHFSGEDTCIDQ
jgi:hypothetical protein